MTATPVPLLIDGAWRGADAARSCIQAVNPRTAQPLPTLFPISPWQEVDEALSAAQAAFDELERGEVEARARFLDAYAARLEARRKELVALAEAETGLAAEPRLNSIELPRMVDQLRQAAAAVRERSWTLATIDTKASLRSYYRALGPVVIFGPNNFPFAYNAISGGDFAAAIAAGNPVIAKGHPSHPGTTRMLAEEALAALKEAVLPVETVQLLYHLSNEDGMRLVQDRRVGAVAFTGSRRGGLALKAAADAVGKPIFLEMGSLNPVVILPGALRERFAEVFNQVSGSCLLGMGQFCTNPGLLFFIQNSETERFVAALIEKYRTTPVGPLLSSTVQAQLHGSVQALIAAGAELQVGGQVDRSAGISYQNTLLTATGTLFLNKGQALQREAFGNATLVVLCADLDELAAVLATLEGQLAGSIYSHTQGDDEAGYRRLESILRLRVGRLLNDKMTTGVAVSSAQNHGGPYPAAGHPHFTAVGFPASIRRFAMLACYDNVRPHRLPPELQDRNPNRGMWRLVDGRWTQEPLA
jgi:alpha-ketoglutaric semialdehyde dehydrogenase